jgi:hypothetical protein
MSFAKLIRGQINRFAKGVFANKSKVKSTTWQLDFAKSFQIQRRDINKFLTHFSGILIPT